MKNHYKIFYLIFLVVIYFGDVHSQKPIVQITNDMKINSIELEHTNPSLGPYEEITIITLYNSKTHLETVNNFINNSQINNTTSLYNFLEANINNETKLLEEVYNNTPKGELNEGEKISNLKIYLEGGKEIVLNDVYRQYSLTHFYPDFTSYMVEHGSREVSRSNSFPTINNEPVEWDSLANEKISYSEKDLIIELQLTPGMPNTSSYQLLVYGNGKFNFTGSSKSVYSPSVVTNKTVFSKVEIDSILAKAEEIYPTKTDNLGSLGKPTMAQGNDAQQLIFSFWQNGSLRKSTFGYGNEINKETRALADYILSLVEGLTLFDSK
jgi:hypothetical protein